ncbi:TonB-dependent siderophore receptor [Shinella sp. CPCC 100929]|uniref:TonB-dependent siderophore receptor n=1 Tax=Shinella lacus TaxID=2654216 RepID=A0ABT1R0M5_9HYPH|nr:TonB-dependent siderophore receptor [Shinella lacus]MCQ4628727.1 TonB-dependent siderophore receptor [Shinella lacus]
MRRDVRKSTGNSTGKGLLATLLAGVCLSAAFAPGLRAEDDPVKSYSVEAGPLSSALAAFSRQAGVQVTYIPSVAARKRTQGASGAMTRKVALDKILQGSGLVYAYPYGSTIAISDPQMDTTEVGAVTNTATTLERVVVDGDATAILQNDGLASAGYKAEMISGLGLLDGLSLKDTPFAVSVMPRELLQNIQAQSPDDVFRLNPSTRSSTPQISGWSPMVNIRGFTTYDSAQDGLRRSYSHATSLEDVERIEILNGLSGFLYGASAPGGMINYVSKRPTDERYNSITLGSYGGEQGYVHGDFGGPIDAEGLFGYRINVVKQAGDTAIDDQNINRGLISGAFDWQVTDQLKLELNASYGRYKTENPSTYWYFAIPHDVVPDPEKNWGQKWIRDEFEKKKVQLKATYELNDAITIRGAYSKEFVDRPVQDHIMNSVEVPGEYTQIGIHSGRTKNEFDAAQLFGDFVFDTGSIGHKVTVGYQMFSDRSWSTSYNPNTGWIGPFPLTTPTHLPRPLFPRDDSDYYYAGRVKNESFVLGDQIDFNERWSALVGASYSKIYASGYDSEGGLSSPVYDEGRLSPSVSLIFKATPSISIYGSYIEGLEQGGVAPDGTTNSGAIMAPMVSTQKEFGIKAEVGDVLLTAALFDIEKAYEFTNGNNVYTQDGRQNHRGIEFTATGNVTDNLTVLGGLTLLDTEVKGGEFAGNDPTNVAAVLAKVYAEYELPSVEGFFLTAGVQHTGKQWADDANTDRLPSFTTFDLGLRYTTTQFGDPLTVRLAVTNVANKGYWQTSNYLGAPRTVAFSIQKQF